MEQDPLVENIQQMGVIVTIVKLNYLNEKVMQPVYVEVRTNEEEGETVHYHNNLARKTLLIEAETKLFYSCFHYNTTELIDDNLTFVLKTREGTVLGSHTIRNLKFFHRQGISEKSIELSNQGAVTAELELAIQFKENQDLISGICVPDLSLVPQYPYIPKYNAIDGYNPDSKSNKANCFSFFDGDKIPGFDNLEIFPFKFKLPKDLK